jgi:coproporphyrinogen III oxidase-like Fe-S oxidoreductase
MLWETINKQYGLGETMAIDLTMRYVDKLADKVASSVSFSKVTENDNVVSTKVDKVGLNIRVPFCALKCAYCAVPGDAYNSMAAKAFLKGVDKELELYSDYLKKPMVERVYISGGTPSLMHREIPQILDMVDGHFDFRGKVAIEASPTDLSPEVVRSLKDSGVTQVSVGVQTFDERMLLTNLNRKTKREDLLRSLRTVMDAGFDYVNIDLMFSLEGQTTESILEDLRTATELGVHGISVYPLMLLPYTPMTKKLADRNGKERWVQDPTIEKEQYLAIVSYLRDHSYKLRTLWSYSLKPEEYEGPYEHNNFLGIGPRAWGMVNNRFTLNCPNVFEYLDRLDSGSLPLFAYSEVKDYPLSRFARKLYNGEVTQAEIEALSAEDIKISGYIGLLRLLGLMKKQQGKVVLTDKAMAYGSHATKKIAMATLAKMNSILREGSPTPGLESVGLEQTSDQMINLEGMVP